jgi:hypothetical protein
MEKLAGWGTCYLQLFTSKYSDDQIEEINKSGVCTVHVGRLEVQDSRKTRNKQSTWELGADGKIILQDLKDVLFEAHWNPKGVPQATWPEQNGTLDLYHCYSKRVTKCHCVIWCHFCDIVFRGNCSQPTVVSFRVVARVCSTKTPGRVGLKEDATYRQTWTEP